MRKRYNWSGRFVAKCSKHQENSVTSRNHDGFDRVQCQYCGSIELRPVNAILFTNVKAMDELETVRRSV